MVGAGITKNKFVGYILVIYLVVILISGFLGQTIKKVGKQSVASEVLNSVGELTLKGNKIGENMFLRFYGNYIFFFNLILIVILAISLFKQQWIYSAALFFCLNYFVILNQIWRRVKND